MFRARALLCMCAALQKLVGASASRPLELYTLTQAAFTFWPTWSPLTLTIVEKLEKLQYSGKILVENH